MGFFRQSSNCIARQVDSSKAEDGTRGATAAGRPRRVQCVTERSLKKRLYWSVVDEQLDRAPGDGGGFGARNVGEGEQE